MKGLAELLTDDVSRHLARIEAAMTRLNRRRWFSSMRPGVSGDHVEALLRSVGLVANPDLLALYGWRNGSSIEGGPSIGDLYILPGFYALSIDDATANYRAFGTAARVGDRLGQAA